MSKVNFRNIAQIMPWPVYLSVVREDDLTDDTEEVTEYAKLVGQAVVDRMILYRSG